MVGIVRSAQLVATLVTAGPIAMVGLLTLYGGDVVFGVAFLAFAVGLVAASEYLYVRLVGRTVGRVKRLGGVPDRLRNRRE